MSQYHYEPGQPDCRESPRWIDTAAMVLLFLLLSVFVSYAILYMWVWAVR